MIKARDEWNVVLGGPGSRLDDYSSQFYPMHFLNSFFRCKIRKDKIKKIFNVDREEK
jgi:hypothetical protein